MLSVPQLTRAGCTIIFREDMCQIFLHSTFLANASFCGKAYYLDVADKNSHRSMSAVETPRPMVTVDAPLNPTIQRLSQYR